MTTSHYLSFLAAAFVALILGLEYHFTQTASFAPCLATMLVTPAFAQPRPAQLYSDAELVKLYQEEEDLTHVVQLLDRYAPALEAISRRYLTRTYTVDDIRHEFLLFLAEKLQSLQVRQSLKGWLCTALRNWLIDRQRQEKTHDHYCNYQGWHAPLSEKACESQLDQQWLVKEALAMLRPEEATCVRLFYLEGYSYEEIAQELDWTFRKVTGHMYRALKRLRQRMDRNSLAASLMTA